ncbi:unnamed protein product [Peronospora destructor]|uniref:Cullin family profile domain-containing protein n=1 Tax=Peronospora destructor TaxID=86335 RepID=A0AAV0UBI8_9STRA|nr:unnamed protein product [Peronospora destructor]
MAANPHKCSNLSVQRDLRGLHKTHDIGLQLDGAPIPALSAADSYQYLGIGDGLDQVRRRVEMALTLSQLKLDTIALLQSGLAQWQVVKAVKVYLYPRVEYVLRHLRPFAQQLEGFDRHLVRGLRHLFCLTKWQDDIYLSADKVFKLLGLNEDGLLTHPLFSYWYTLFKRYIYSQRYPDFPNFNKEMISFLRIKARDKGITFEKFLENEVEKAKLETKSRVDELFLELKLDNVEDGLFTNPLFKFWCDCLEKFNAGKPKESQTSVVKSLQTVYGYKRLFYLLQAEQKITTSAEYAQKMEKDLLTTFAVNGKSLDDVFKLLGLNSVGYKLLENPLMKTFVKFVKAVDTAKDPGKLQTVKEDFVEKEILNGIELASNAGELQSTDLEKVLFRLWFTHEKDPKEVFEMLFREDDLVKILNDGGNLFEIPLFVTFLKYAKAYSGTKRLATAKELEAGVSNPKKRKWKIDPTTKVEYVDREADSYDNLEWLSTAFVAPKTKELAKKVLAALLNKRIIHKSILKEFEEKMMKLDKMDMVQKRLGSTSIQHQN